MSAEWAARNRAIKKLLEEQYGKGKVRIKGTHDGYTAGSVYIIIETPPADGPTVHLAEIAAKLRNASIKISASDLSISERQATNH